MIFFGLSLWKKYLESAMELREESAMELRDLSYFCITAELEHVTKAARILGIAQPFLTKIISQIEAEVGGSLFDRIGRGIKLNHNGEVFYRKAKRVLACMDDLYTEMDYTFERHERTITFLCNTESFSHSLIKEFKESPADYSLSIRFAPKSEMQDKLASGEADFVFCCPPIVKDSIENLVTENIFCKAGYVLLPPEHPYIELDLISLDDLRDLPLITMPKESAMRNMLDPLFDNHFFHPHIELETNCIDAIIDAVMNGWGYAFITNVIINNYPEIKQYVVALDGLDMKTGYFGLSYYKYSIQNRNAEHFIQFFQTYIRNLSRRLYGEDYSIDC